MIRKLSVISFLLVTFSLCAQLGSTDVTIRAGDIQGLITAIENANKATGGRHFIRVQAASDGNTTFNFTEAYQSGSSALPPLTGSIFISSSRNGNRITFKRDINAPQFRLIETTGSSDVILDIINIENFSTANNGGAILVGDSSTLTSRGVNFMSNFAAQEGGAIFVADSARILVYKESTTSISNVTGFSNNIAGSVGGAVSIQSSNVSFVEHQLFTNNSAGVFGCDINFNSQGSAFASLFVFGNIFDANCSNVLVENPSGKIKLSNNTFAGIGDAIDSTDLVDLFSNIFDMTPSDNNKSQPAVGLKALCNDFGSNAFNSLGHNISNESSCDLDQSTDLPNTDPMINPLDVNGVISLQVGSPAIDAGASEMQDNSDGLDFLPCGYIDSRGLGRPQDANGDGVFECDMGSYEVQGGPDLTAAQSGLYFDTGRDGEGIHVEMLDNDTALVAMFTYHPNGTDLMWFVGSGNRVGNSVVIDDMYRASGGAFGTGFDADQVEFEVVGSLSLVFPNCAATDKPGRMVFASNQQLDQPIENLLVEAFTLSRLLNCSQIQSSAKTGRSGSFFDPQRNGEGLFIDVIDDDTAVVFFYTFTPTGEQLWLVGSGASIVGDTITATMLYPTSTTGFGNDFDANEIQFSSWGSMSIKHQAGCNNLLINYNSTVPGYGNGNLNHSRLTQPAGTTCDL